MESTIIMVVGLLAIFYFFAVRPENKRKKAAQEMRDSLKKGDRLTTIGGIVGTVVKVNPTTLIIETSEDRVRMEITKWAVSTTGVQTDQTVTNTAKKKKDGEPSDEVPEEPALPEAPAEAEEKKEYDPEC